MNNDTGDHKEATAVGLYVRGYNDAIQQAIEVVRDEKKEDWGYPVDNAIEEIIEKLTQLKK